MKKVIDREKSGGKPMPDKMNAIGLAYLKATPQKRQEFIEQVQQAMDVPEMRAVLQTKFVSRQAYAAEGGLPMSVIKAAHDVLGVATVGHGQDRRTAGLSEQLTKYARN